MQHAHGSHIKANIDSLIVAGHVIDVKMSILGLDHRDAVDPGTLDSLMADAHSSITESNVTTSPDGKLKLILITEDFCGAYCHSEYVSFAHLANGKQLKGTVGLHPIEHIYILPDGKYLLLQSWSERAFSACSDNAQAATIISLHSDSVIDHSAMTADDGSGSRIEFRTSFSYYPTPFYLRYDPDKQTLSYQYGNPCSYSETLPEVHTGTLQYQHGVFVPVRDSIWTVPPGNDH